MAKTKTQTELTGVLRSVVFEDIDQPSIILKMDNGTSVLGRARGSDFAIGLTYRFLGRWTTHPKYGQQFRFETWIRAEPATKAGVICYLAKVCPHVGPVIAKKLWDAFGEKAVETLRTNPDAVAAKGILNADQAGDASLVLHNESAFEQTKITLYELLAGRGFPIDAIIAASLRLWGARAGYVIRKNPYALLVKGLPGCGFKRCDKLYLDLGYPKDRLKRQLLCAWHSLRDGRSGNTWHASGVVTQAIHESVSGANLDPFRAIVLGRRAKVLAVRKDRDGVWVAEFTKAKSEQDLAFKVLDLLKD